MQDVNEEDNSAEKIENRSNDSKEIKEDQEIEDIAIISRHDTIEFKKRRVFYLSIIVASTVISAFLVNIDFIKYYYDLLFFSQDISAYIPILSHFNYIIDSFNILYLLAMFLAVYTLIKFGIWTCYERDRTELLIMHERGFSDKELIISKLREFRHFSIKGTVIGTALGAFIGIFFSYVYTVEEDTVSFIFPYAKYYFSFLPLIFLTYFPLLAIIMTILVVGATISVFYQIKSEIFGKDYIEEEVLGFDIVRTIKNNEKLILTILTIIIVISSSYFFIDTLISTNLMDFVDEVFDSLYTLDLYFNLLPLLLLLIIEIVYIFNNNKPKYRKINIAICFVIFDLFLLNEIALATLEYDPNIVIFINNIPTSDLFFWLFVMFASFALAEILANKIVGAFGFFTIFGILSTNLDVTNIFFLIILSFVAFFIFIIGASNINDKIISKSFIGMTTLTKDIFGRTQGFISPRMLSRRGIYTSMTASFLMFAILASLTSSISYTATINTYSDDAKWETGSDIRLGLAPYSKTIEIPVEDDIETLESFSSVEAATRVLIWNYYFTGFSESINTTELVLIEPLKYLEAGFYRDDWFTGGTTEELFNELFEDKNTIILDTDRARLLGKEIGDNIVIKNLSGNPRQIYEVRIIGLVDYFALGYSIEDNSIPSFGIMSIEMADPVFVALNNFALHEKNPTSCYLLKMKSTSNHDQLITEFREDTGIDYFDVYDCYSYIDIINKQGSSDELRFTPQILGSVAIGSLFLAIFGFVRINATLAPEEEQDYALLRILGVDKTHLYLITFAENFLLTITTLVTSFLTSLFISFSLNVMFLPKTALPKLFDLIGILDSTVASLLSITVVSLLIIILFVIPGLIVILNENYQETNYKEVIKSKSKFQEILYNPKTAISVTIVVFAFLLVIIDIYTEINLLEAIVSTVIAPWLNINDFSAFNINLLFYGIFFGLILSIRVRTRRILKATKDFTGRQKAGFSNQLHRG